MITTRIPHYIKLGSKDQHWYAETKKMLVDMYGESKLKLVTQLFAATSINSSLKSNVRLFRKALHEIDNDLPFSNYLPVMRMQLDRIRNGEELSGRKINAFAKAMSGDTNAVVVDIWLLRAFQMDRKYKRHVVDYDNISHTLHSRKTLERSSGATDKQFTMVEDYVRGLSTTYQLNGIPLSPAELSAMIWSGVRGANSREKVTRYDRILRFQNYNMYES